MTDRERRLDRLTGEGVWDVVVVGGGATGLGAALDAASRGYRTALLEAHDLAKGTSSRSTKLIHGGVRYLAQGNVSLVREALRERGRLLRNAPHLVHDRRFLVPSYRFGGRAYYRIGLGLYDVLAGGESLGRSRGVDAAEALGLVPTLEPRGLRGGVLYHDGQFDDARLAVALARTAEDHGGLIATGLEVTGLLKDRGGRVAGVESRDAESGRTLAVQARAVVNATGVFADALRKRDDPATPPTLAPSQGVHVVLDRRFLPGDTAVLVPKTDDGRVLFAIPWLGRVLVGTTDTPVNRADVEPRALDGEVEFLLRHAARYLTEDPGPSDVRSVFAGLRPLIAPSRGASGPTSRLSREHLVETSPTGLVTVTGGKWTTYRKMAEDAVEAAAAVAGLPRRPCVTAALRLRGAPVTGGDRTPDDPLAPYGSDAPDLRRLIGSRPAWDRPLHPLLPYVAGEVVWAARFELARTVEDVLARRTRALFLDARASAECAPDVARLLAEELGRDEAWAESQTREFRALASGYLPSL